MTHESLNLNVMYIPFIIWILWIVWYSNIHQLIDHLINISYSPYYYKFSIRLEWMKVIYLIFYWASLRENYNNIFKNVLRCSRRIKKINIIFYQSIYSLKLLLFINLFNTSKPAWWKNYHYVNVNIIIKKPLSHKWIPLS